MNHYIAFLRTLVLLFVLLDSAYAATPDHAGELLEALRRDDGNPGTALVRGVVEKAPTFQEFLRRHGTTSREHAEILDEECSELLEAMRTQTDDPESLRFAAMRFLKNLLIIEQLPNYDAMPPAKTARQVELLLAETPDEFKDGVREILNTLAARRVTSIMKTPLGEEKLAELAQEIGDAIKGSEAGRAPNLKALVARSCAKFWADPEVSLAEMSARCGFSQKDYESLLGKQRRKKLARRRSASGKTDREALAKLLSSSLPPQCVEFLLPLQAVADSRLEGMHTSMLRKSRRKSLEVRDQCRSLLLPILVKSELRALRDQQVVKVGSASEFLESETDAFVLRMPTLEDAVWPIFLADVDYRGLEEFSVSVLGAYPSFRPLVFPVAPEGLVYKVEPGKWSVSALQGRYSRTSELAPGRPPTPPPYNGFGVSYDLGRMAYFQQQILWAAKQGLNVREEEHAGQTFRLYRGLDGASVVLAVADDEFRLYRTRFGEMLEVDQKLTVNGQIRQARVKAPDLLTVVNVSSKRGMSARIYNGLAEEQWLIFRNNPGRHDIKGTTPEELLAWQNMVVKYWFSTEGASTDAELAGLVKHQQNAAEDAPGISALWHLDKAMRLAIRQQDEQTLHSLLAMFDSKLADHQLPKFRESYLRKAYERAKELRAGRAAGLLKEKWLSLEHEDGHCR